MALSLGSEKRAPLCYRTSVASSLGGPDPGDQALGGRRAARDGQRGIRRVRFRRLWMAELISYRDSVVGEEGGAELDANRQREDVLGNGGLNHCA